MALIIAVLRILIPLAIFIILLVIVIPRYLRNKEKQSGRIDVEADVVSSKQHPYKASDIPKSTATPVSKAHEETPEETSSAETSSAETPPNNKE